MTERADRIREEREHLGLRTHADLHPDELAQRPECHCGSICGCVCHTRGIRHSVIVAGLPPQQPLPCCGPGSANHALYCGPDHGGL